MADWLPLCLGACSALLCTCLVIGAMRRLVGTTLMAVGAWVVVSVSIVAIFELAASMRGSGASLASVRAMRWTVACGTFCPMMALLGAKRPQDRGWQWIVLSLWVILALPAAQSLALGRSFELWPAWWIFAWALVAIGTTNMLATKHWVSAVCVSMGQAALLLGYADDGYLWPAIGLGLFAAAAIAAHCVTARQQPEIEPLDRTWRDFRDMFGVVWALRIAEQLNKSSEMYGWGVTAHWDGLVDSKTGQPAKLDDSTEAAIARSLRTMLRRFVSPAWLDSRLSDCET